MTEIPSNPGVWSGQMNVETVEGAVMVRVVEKVLVSVVILVVVMRLVDIEVKLCLCPYERPRRTGCDRVFGLGLKSLRCRHCPGRFGRMSEGSRLRTGRESRVARPADVAAVVTLQARWLLSVP